MSRNRPIYLSALGFFWVWLLMLLGQGCQQNEVYQLDQQLAQLIREHQSQALGNDAQHDKQRVPIGGDDQNIDDSVYAGNPATQNPTYQNLPARSEKRLKDQHASTSNTAQKIGQDVDEAHAFELQHCLAYAIEHGYEYRNRKETLYLAAISLLSENHLWGPRFFHKVTASVQGTPKEGDYDQAFNLINELGVTQRLPYGGSVSATALVGYVEALRASSGTGLNPGQDGSLNLSIDLPLLRGSGQVARESLIQAQRDLVYAVRRFEQFRRRFLVDIATTYFGLLADQARIANNKAQFANLQALAKQSNALANAGKLAYFEVQRAQQQALVSENNLVNRRDTYATNLDRFKIQLGMPTTLKLTILASELVIPTPALDSTQAIGTAYQYQLDLQTTRDRVADSVRQLRISRDALQAGLGFFASVGLAKDSDKVNTGFDLEAGAGSYEAGIRLDLPIDKRIEYLAYRSALVGLERARRAYRQSKDQLALDVRRSIRDIQLAKFTLRQQEVNTQLAEKRLRGVKLRLRSLGPRDLVEAEEERLQAYDRKDDAKRSLRVSILQYLLNTGQMRVDSQGNWIKPRNLKTSDALDTTDPINS